MKYWVLALLVVSGALLYFFENEEYQDFSNLLKTAESIQPSLGRAKVAEPNSTSATRLPDPVESLNPVDPDDIFPGNGGVVYRSINNSNHDPELLKQIREELENFQKYGSIGKGKTTIEFEKTQDLKEALSKKGINSLINGLAFNPTQISNIVGSEFSMIGADDQGKMIPGLGWNGFFQSFENGSTGRQIELSESQIETMLGDETEIIEEFLNAKVGDVRASVQAMKDERGNDVYSIQWDDGDRSFTLNTKSFVKEDSLALATVILERYRLLPHKGWKIPYALDSNNPLHRIAIQRDQQRMGEKSK